MNSLQLLDKMIQGANMKSVLKLSVEDYNDFLTESVVGLKNKDPRFSMKGDKMLYKGFVVRSMPIGGVKNGFVSKIKAMF